MLYSMFIKAKYMKLITVKYLKQISNNLNVKLTGSK